MSFGAEFQRELDRLFLMRRDVRRFKSDPVERCLIDTCLATFHYAPSVGLSQPWRIVEVTSDPARAAVLANFKSANETALNGYGPERAQLYAGLKLAGLKESPVQIALFCDDETEQGHGLGAQTMPEMRRYSVVAALMQFWLLLRAKGLGLGWVSILDPAQLAQDLDVPATWHLVAYLCIGWPEDAEAEIPELARVGWEQRAADLHIVTR